MTTNIRNFFSASAITGIATLATISFLASATPAFADTEPGYSHDSATGSDPYWMTPLPDSLKLSYMSIPGTHDSMARIGGDAVQTQSMDLNTQLYSGIRVLDIRILAENNQFDLCHGDIPQPGSFDGVMQTVISFLHSFPRETVLMRIKFETNGLGNTQSFEEVFRNYWGHYSNVFWMNPNRETNPTLGEIRGKVVVLKDFTSSGAYGLDYSKFHAQDNYSLNDNWDLYGKWTDVKNQLVQANAVGTSCVFGSVCFSDPGAKEIQMINYLSGATGVLPYFVASGKSNHDTDAPLLATAETTPAFSNYPDFPRVNCVYVGYEFCTIAYEGTNNLTYQWLAHTPQVKRVGIIMADFPGLGLIQQVIAVNQRAVAGF